MRDFKFLKGQKNSREYDSPGFEFAGVSPIIYNPYTFSQVRYMLFRNTTNGEVIRGNQINDEHPMWNHND